MDPRGCQGRVSHLGSKLFNFHIVFGKKFANFGSWRPLSRKSSIRHWWSHLIRKTELLYCIVWSRKVHSFTVQNMKGVNNLTHVTSDLQCSVWPYMGYWCNVSFTLHGTGTRKWWVSILRPTQGHGQGTIVIYCAHPSPYPRAVCISHRAIKL